MSTQSNPPPTEALDDNSDNSAASSLDVDVRWWTGRTRGPTFSSDKVKWWTEQHIDDADSVLNPCAGPTQLNVGEVLRVEVNPENGTADVYADFRNLLVEGHVEPGQFDVIVYDPPYSEHQAIHKYRIDLGDDGFYFYNNETKKYLDTLLAPGGIIIQFGYTTRIMPRSLGYEYEAVSVFNKTGCQNDYLGAVARKPARPVGSVSPLEAPSLSHSRVLPNEGSDQIENKNITVDGNDGQPVDAYYSQLPADSHFCNELSKVAGMWIEPGDRVLHVFENEPRVNIQTDCWTTCAYRSPDLTSGQDDVVAEVVEAPWNIGATFATGVFDVVILDLPHTAWQTNIRTPGCQGRDGSDVTHVDTAIKRSISDLVKGDGGRVIQIGKTATLMSGVDYSYTRSGICVVQQPGKEQDRIVVVDEKQHSNLELASIGEGAVDGEYHHPHGAPHITSKYNRTDFAPDPDSHFCVHCGNNFNHHPAAYVWCPDCNAAGGEMCRHPTSGEPVYPSGPDHLLVADDLCTGRLRRSREYHSGDCNSKPKSHLIQKEGGETSSKAPTSDSVLSEFV